MEELCARLGVVVDATPSASVGLTTEEAERCEYHPQARVRAHAEPPLPVLGEGFSCTDLCMMFLHPFMRGDSGGLWSKDQTS
jgi:hypothetical protein